jgi:ankyrin repeat protein
MNVLWRTAAICLRAAALCMWLALVGVTGCMLSPGGHPNRLKDAAASSNTNEVNRLLDRGAGINRPSSYRPWGGTRDVDNETPLTAVALRGNQDMVRLLLDRGADPNALDGFKRSPLEGAIQSRNLGAVTLLVDAGAEFRVDGRHIFTLPRYGDKPLDAAVVNYVLAQGGGAALTARDIHGLSQSYREQPEVFDWFFEHKDEDINTLFWTERSSNFHYYPLIHLAVMRGHTNVIQTLLDHGTDINLGCEGAGGATPLMFAAAHTKPEVVSLFLSRGADVERQSRFGGNALHSAAQRGMTENVKRLLAENASAAFVNATNSLGMTALHVAAASPTSDLSCFTLLVKHGARVDATDRKGETPLDYAKEVLPRSKDHTEKQGIVDYLRSLQRPTSP